MVSSWCSSCMRHISIPSNSARPNRHVCEVCKRGFCNMCGTPFICRKCLAQIDMNDQRAIRQQSEKYRAKAGGGTAMTAAGAVLLMIAGYTVYYFVLLAFSPYYGGTPFIVAPIFEVAIGLGLFIAGLSTLANSKGTVLNAIRQSSTRQPSSLEIGSVTGGTSWIASSPAIPSSAFVPVIQGLPSQPASIPESAYVPEPQPSPAARSAPAPRARSNMPSARTNTSVQFCGQCGDQFPNVAGLKFCPSCGSPRD